MTIHDLLHDAEIDGVTLEIHGDKLAYSGDQAAVERWLPVLRERKAEIVSFLTADPEIDLAASYEFFVERAAIMEYDGGLDRETAERQALVSVIKRVFAGGTRTEASWKN